MNLRGLYTGAVRSQLKNLYGAWEPSRPMTLGQFGILHGDWFEPLGLLEDLGISLETVRSKEPVHQTFTSNNSVKVNLHARGAVPQASAKLEISFGTAGSVFLDAAGCIYEAVRSKHALGDQLKTNPGFEKDWVVVTDLLTAERSIVVISSEANASATFEAKAGVEVIDLADGGIELKATVSRSIGYIVKAERGLTPLIGLSGLRRRFLDPQSTFRSMSDGLIPEQSNTPEKTNDVEFRQL